MTSPSASQPSPLPWLSNHHVSNQPNILDADARRIFVSWPGCTSEKRVANARLIVQSVNSNAALVAALEKAASLIMRMSDANGLASTYDQFSELSTPIINEMNDEIAGMRAALKLACGN